MSGEDVLQLRVLRLSREHGALVHGIARRYAHTPADVEDLVQDVWTRVVEILPRKNPASPDHRWLCAVAANVGYEFVKRRKRLARLKSLVGLFPRDGDVPGPLPETLDDSAAFRIWRAIDALPELQRKVVLHRVIEGLSTDETARTINRAEGTVKASLHRALKTLGVQLADLEAHWSSGDL